MDAWMRGYEAQPTAFNTATAFPFRNKQRMHFALKSLLQEAQNNLRIFKVRAVSSPCWFPSKPTTLILTTGSVITYIELSGLVCLRQSSVLDNAGGADGAERGRGQGRASLGRR